MLLLLYKKICLTSRGNNNGQSPRKSFEGTGSTNSLKTIKTNGCWHVSIEKLVFSGSDGLSEIDMGHPLSLGIKACNDSAGSFKEMCSEEISKNWKTSKRSTRVRRRRKVFLADKRSYLWRKKLQDSVDQRVLLGEAFCYNNSDIPAIQKMEVFDCENGKDEEKDEEKKKSKKKKTESIKRKKVKITAMLLPKKKKTL